MVQKVSNDDAKKFQYVNNEIVACIGQSPTADHPLVYIKMDDNKAVCPYCNTIYLYKNGDE